ncbi:MAG: Asp-tRNA(Asn)/Glu-tRNA(Gln) amidotransferase subunit GatA, partial [Thermoanaerobaculia bacterium]
MSDILELPFTDVSDPRYVAESLSAIEKKNPALNAFLRVNRDAAGAFPVAIKDNIVTTGMPTTCASRI